MYSLFIQSNTYLYTVKINVHIIVNKPERVRIL